MPAAVQNDLQRIKGKFVVAGCSRTYSATELAGGALQHLGVGITRTGIQFPPSIVPPAKSGKFSERNLDGYEEIRKDLPKETHYNSIDSPNWGDWTHGSHTVELPYDRYPRDFHSPELIELKIRSATGKSKRSKYVLIFEIDKVVDKTSRTFNDEMLTCLNLLQENIGACGIQKSGATVRDYVKSLRVSWELLPPGTLEEAIGRLFHKRSATPEERETITDRYKFLIGLGPQKLVYGLSGNQRYFGGLLRKDLVVFENVEYGNAIYVMFDDWKRLSKRSRTELLSGRFGKKFERVIHKKGWKSKVKEILENAPN